MATTVDALFRFLEINVLVLTAIIVAMQFLGGSENIPNADEARERLNNSAAFFALSGVIAAGALFLQFESGLIVLVAGPFVLGMLALWHGVRGMVDEDNGGREFS